MQDYEIIERVQKGDGELFELLVRKYEKRLFFLAWRMLHNRVDVEDAVQEIFVKAYKGLIRFRGDSQFSTWLYRIATNHILNIIRKKSSNRLVERDIESESSSSTPRSSSRNTRLKKAVEAAIQSLPPRQQAVFHMRYEEERPHAEIAEILGLSEGAVKASYHHAVLKLRESLKGFVDER